MVGMAARMRVSSLTLPSSMGTLKSTRTRTRLPCGIEVPDRELVHGRLSGRSVARRGRAQAEARGHEARRRSAHAAAVAPLVVVPGDDLHEVAAQRHRATPRR